LPLASTKAGKGQTTWSQHPRFARLGARALALAVLLAGSSVGEIRSCGSTNLTPGIAYDNDRRPKEPWSIHVIRVPRRSASFELHAWHAQGRALGLAPVTSQTKLLEAGLGIPVAAINGDFYLRDGAYAGHPRGVQIVEGELLSAPGGTSSFWIDILGEPHTADTVSRFQIVWPDASTTPVGLNGRRRADGLELYTPAVGPSTRTVKGCELVLERPGNSPWLPLRPGKTYRARVREVRDAGDTRIAPETLVLSMGPAVAAKHRRIPVGAEITISTATEPSLRGAKTAISGGPVLVRDGKRQRIRVADSDSYEATSLLERHPRSAVGWNDDYFFLVAVDGRHRGVSAGMTLSELTSYLMELGCQEAMNLDGGGSATLWYDGKVRNRPCDGYERAVANSLVVVQKK